MPDRHKQRPVSLRIPDLSWWQQHADETGRPLRRALLDALAEYRARAALPAPQRKEIR